MLIAFLRANADVFAWQPSDMPGVPREVIEHHLAVFPDAQPIRHMVHRQALERQDVIRLKVDKLLRAGFIREVRHPDWLANPVVVPKANDKWRVCIDYTDLNKCCMQYTLHSQLGRNVEAYVDDLVVKTRSHTSLLEELDETFHNLGQTRMSLSREKCVFGIPAGKILGLLVSNRGVEANPDKIGAL